MIMGTGFPPFRGGLLRFADTYGLARVREDLAKWKERFGARFETPESLESRSSFY